MRDSAQRKSGHLNGRAWEAHILFGSSTDEQRSSNGKDLETRRAVFWRASGGVAPQSESATAILPRRALPAARQKTARPFLILIQALSTKQRRAGPTVPPSLAVTVLVPLDPPP